MHEVGAWLKSLMWCLLAAFVFVLFVGATRMRPPASTIGALVIVLVTLRTITRMPGLGHAGEWLQIRYRQRRRSRSVMRGRYVPHTMRPPPHARLADGTNGYRLMDELAAHHRAGVELDAALTGRTATREDLLEWILQVSASLSRIVAEQAGRAPARPADEFSTLASDIALVDADSSVRTVALLRRYLALTLNYVSEVRKAMPDYIEASGQSRPAPQYNQTFNAPVNQAAMKIENNSSTISTEITGGDSEMVTALRAIEAAIRAEPELSDGQRLELLDNLGDLTDAANASPEGRRRGRIRAALDAITNAATAGTELNRAVEAWGGVLGGLMS
ncbi:MAG: hypothetical protein HOQ44_17200 [Nocardia sp.]|nr:hypothetical protein [Nocardia sp.]